ncbi:MAG: DNA replication and repair protein RecF [Oscillospiraceae bacterium]|jgi:DNA replication and repair protein RecF|nr:DNA replication and repair protein RecF [Oscillospiraceae bacterium]
MILDSLELTGFRNYASARARFSPGANVIFGKNAQGKTNLLEAVCLLSLGRSHRGARDRDMITFGGDMARIEARGRAFGRELLLELRLRRVGRRETYRNGVKLSRAAEPGVAAVMFEPEDLELVRGGAAGRRAELDACISQLRPAYSAALAGFNRLYAGKLRILRDHREKPTLLDALDDYNHGLCQYGAKLIFYRASFVRKLASTAALVHRECSGGTEELQMLYKTERGAETDGAGPAPEEIRAVAAALMARQREHREHEIASGACLVGAQRDDIELQINGVPARAFASQGQARTAALAVKLAERALMAEELGELPILLLDDVLSELDETRREFVLRKIHGGQVLITCCEPGDIAPADGGGALRVENGGIISEDA